MGHRSTGWGRLEWQGGQGGGGGSAVNDTRKLGTGVCVCGGGGGLGAADVGHRLCDPLYRLPCHLPPRLSVCPDLPELVLHQVLSKGRST